MDHITLPIIIADKNGRDLIIFRSVEEAELHIEAIDVINSEYTGFDADGHLLDINVSQQRTSFLEKFFQGNQLHVTITRTSDTNVYLDKLRNRLLEYSGLSNEDFKDESIAQLIQRVGFYGGK